MASGEAQHGRRDAHERIGRVLADRWMLERVLGTGGSACVYRARHRNGHLAALKVLHPELAANPRVRHRFLQEGYAANRVTHPGVVRILDDAETADGLVFLVMDLLEGDSLAARLASTGPLAPDQVGTIAIQVLDVLAAAHDAGIVHRDVKPSNVFLTDDGAIKVLDFGAARLREAEDFITRSGTVLGTPAFMAPELAAGETERVGPRSDVWAVGATMFQLLTGKTVHRARSPNEALVAAATKRAPSVAESCPALSEELTYIIDRALAFHPEDRWPNARSMRAALSSAGHGQPAPDENGSPTLQSLPAPMPAVPRRSSRKTWLLWAASMSLLVGASLWLALAASMKARPATRLPSENASSHEKAAPSKLAVDQVPIVASSALVGDAPPRTPAVAPSAVPPPRARIRSPRPEESSEESFERLLERRR